MLFNSYEFILLFLPLTWAGYFLLARHRLTLASTGFLVAASLFFYGWWNPVYVPLLAASILFNFAVGRKIEQSVLETGG